MDHHVVNIDALHLLAVGEQKFNLLLGHGEEDWVCGLWGIANIRSLALPSLNFFEIEAFISFIKPPLLEVKLDFSDGGIFDGTLVAIERRNCSSYLEPLALG